jgi:hypothetical protein
MTVEQLEAIGNQVEETNLESQNHEVLALSIRKTTLPGNRPIEASHLNIVRTYTSVGGIRPVTAGDMKISSSITVSGHRPIAVSTLKISDVYSVMGNRPVASNDIDDSTGLMGYLD